MVLPAVAVGIPYGAPGTVMLDWYVRVVEARKVGLVVAPLANSERMIVPVAAGLMANVWAVVEAEAGNVRVIGLKPAAAVPEGVTVTVPTYPIICPRLL